MKKRLSQIPHFVLMFFNKTKRQGENHNLTEEKERWEGGIGQVNSVSNARRYC